MTPKRLALLLCCISIFTWIAASANAPGVQLIRRGGIDRIDTIAEQLGRGMKWSHGAYLVEDAIAGQPPVFYTLDRDGELTNTARFRNLEPGVFYSLSNDRETDGAIVFSGQIESPQSVSPFLAWISADGQTQRIVRTGHYFPYQLAVAPDGTIWTLGYEWTNLGDDDPALNKEAPVLRHFDNAGNLIGSAFPQSQFNRKQRFRITNGLLVATGDRLGWYGPRNWEAPTYTEISLPAMTMKSYPGVPCNSVKSDLAVGLAMTGGGVASVSIQDGSPGHRTNYVFDRASSSWMPISVPLMGGFKFTPILIGSDGDNLVFQYGREAGFFSVAVR